MNYEWYIKLELLSRRLLNNIQIIINLFKSYEKNRRKRKNV